MNADIENALNAFERAVENAWISDANEHASERKQRECFDKLQSAKRHFVQLLEDPTRVMEMRTFLHIASDVLTDGCLAHACECNVGTGVTCHACQCAILAKGINGLLEKETASPLLEMLAEAKFLLSAPMNTIVKDEEWSTRREALLKRIPL